MTEIVSDPLSVTHIPAAVPPKGKRALVLAVVNDDGTATVIEAEIERTDDLTSINVAERIIKPALCGLKHRARRYEK